MQSALLSLAPLNGAGEDGTLPRDAKTDELISKLCSVAVQQNGSMPVEPTLSRISVVKLITAGRLLLAGVGPAGGSENLLGLVNGLPHLPVSAATEPLLEELFGTLASLLHSHDVQDELRATISAKFKELLQASCLSSPAKASNAGGRGAQASSASIMARSLAQLPASSGLPLSPEHTAEMIQALCARISRDGPSAAHDKRVLGQVMCALLDSLYPQRSGPRVLQGQAKGETAIVLADAISAAASLAVRVMDLASSALDALLGNQEGSARAAKEQIQVALPWAMKSAVTAAQAHSKAIGSALPQLRSVSDLLLVVTRKLLVLAQHEQAMQAEGVSTQTALEVCNTAVECVGESIEIQAQHGQHVVSDAAAQLRVLLLDAARLCHNELLIAEQQAAAKESEAYRTLKLFYSEPGFLGVFFGWCKQDPEELSYLTAEARCAGRVLKSLSAAISRVLKSSWRFSRSKEVEGLAVSIGTLLLSTPATSPSRDEDGSDAAAVSAEMQALCLAMGEICAHFLLDSHQTIPYIVLPTLLDVISSHLDGLHPNIGACATMALATAAAATASLSDSPEHIASPMSTVAAGPAANGDSGGWDASKVVTRTLELLSRLYTDPSFPCRSAVAGALVHLATVFEDTKLAWRQVLVEGLLSLVAEAGRHVRLSALTQIFSGDLRAGGDAGGKSTRYLRRRDVSLLMPALARAMCSPLACSKASPGTFMHAVSELHAVANGTLPAGRQSELLGQDYVQAGMRAYRTAWLYIAALRLDLGEADATVDDLGLPKIAAYTPPLLMGTAYKRLESEVDVQERIEHLTMVNDAQSYQLAAHLATHMAQTLGVRKVAFKALGLHAGTLAHILIMVHLETCRTKHAPLCAGGFESVHAIFAYFQGAGHLDTPVVAKLGERSFPVWLKRVEGMHPAVETPGGVIPAAKWNRVESAVLVLVRNLVAPQEGEDDGTTYAASIFGSAMRAGVVSSATCPSQLLADECLSQALRAYPSALYSKTCLRGILANLGLEYTEGDTDVAVEPENHIAQMSLEWLRKWVDRSARFSPSVMESAIQHILLRVQQRSGALLMSHPERMKHVTEVLGSCSRAKAVAASLDPGSREYYAEDTALANSVAALNLKSAYVGRMQGMLALVKAGEGNQGAYDQLMTKLAAEMRDLGKKSLALLDISKSPQTPAARLRARQDALAKLRDNTMLAAALLAELSASARTISTGLSTFKKMIESLVMEPIRSGDVDTIRLASMAWHWAVASSQTDSLSLMILSEVSGSLVWMQKHHVGIFSLGAGDPEESTQEVRGQQAVLSFLLEHLNARYRSPSPDARAYLDILLRDVMTVMQVGTEDFEARPPAAQVARFQFLYLAVETVKGKLFYANNDAPSERAPLVMATAKILRTGLLTFSEPTSWCGVWSKAEAFAQSMVALQLADALATLPDYLPKDASGPVDVSAKTLATIQKNRDLFTILLQVEADRLRVWADPLQSLASKVKDHGAVLNLSRGIGVRVALGKLSSKELRTMAETAWAVSPNLAVALASKPSTRPLEAPVLKILERTLRSGNMGVVQHLPTAAVLLYQNADEHSVDKNMMAQLLASMAPATPEESMQLMNLAGETLNVRQYVCRSLQSSNPDSVVFYMPQLVQSLRYERTSDSGPDQAPVHLFLLETAKASSRFCHRLIWTLQSEGRPPEEAFNPEIKRSGWEPPEDTGLWDVCDEMREIIIAGLPKKQKDLMDDEFEYFDAITDISGKMKPIPAENRRAAIADMIEEVNVGQQERLDRGQVYLPTYTYHRVVRGIPESGCPMQSAAKFPILVAFEAREMKQDEQEDHAVTQRSTHRRKLTRIRSSTMARQDATSVVSYIFKVGDDVRQDVLALQVIHLLKDAFTRAGLHLSLFPYGCIPTGYERGIIEVVPNTKSRDALGNTSDGGLLDIFRREFGSPHSPRFEQARMNFIRSSAGYAVASYLLQSKDRHNGNILIDKDGNLIHIDFGFILEISPGGNMRFESADFKLSHEMTQLIDPGGKMKSPEFLQFQELVIKGFLVARSLAREIMSVVGLMEHSGLPCFGYGKPLPNLMRRFKLELTDREAADHMLATVKDSYDNWRTKAYDIIQFLQQDINK
ncbi:unnamed protein product [Pedinophyceae sp. YPF-701]|nr:unnamed protein product [Pedinophyceae sp. YPF-701]